EELLAPDAGGDVHPALVPLPPGLQPAVPDRRDPLADRGRLQDGRGRNEQERLLAAAVVRQGNVANAVQPVPQGEGVRVMRPELLAQPAFLEQTGRRGGGGTTQARVKHHRLDALAAGVGRGRGAKQPASDNEKGRHSVTRLSRTLKRGGSCSP